MLLAMSLVLAAEQVPAVQDSIPVTHDSHWLDGVCTGIECASAGIVCAWQGVIHLTVRTDADGIVRIMEIPEVPLLVLDGKPIFAQEFLAPATGDLLATVPGYVPGSLAGFPISDATVMVDGVRFDVGGRLGR